MNLFLRALLLFIMIFVIFRSTSDFWMFFISGIWLVNMSLFKKWMMRSASEPVVSVQDNRLALTHLRKLFADFKNPTAKNTQKDQEDRLYSMLPIFCKVSSNLTNTIAIN